MATTIEPTVSVTVSPFPTCTVAVKFPTLPRFSRSSAPVKSVIFSRSRIFVRRISTICDPSRSWGNILPHPAMRPPTSGDLSMRTTVITSYSIHYTKLYESVLWRNPYANLPVLRRFVQGFYLLFFVFVGIEFASFYRQILAGGPVTAYRPPAVEGFLPISALVGLKRFLLTGSYDTVHPAGLTILIAAILSSFFARKVFCSWVCPVGGISRALEWVGKKSLWKNRKTPVLVNRGVDLSLCSRITSYNVCYTKLLRGDAPLPCPSRARIEPP